MATPPRCSRVSAPASVQHLQVTNAVMSFLYSRLPAAFPSQSPRRSPCGRPEGLTRHHPFLDRRTSLPVTAVPPPLSFHSRDTGLTATKLAPLPSVLPRHHSVSGCLTVRPSLHSRARWPPVCKCCAVPNPPSSSVSPWASQWRWLTASLQHWGRSSVRTGSVGTDVLPGPRAQVSSENPPPSPSEPGPRGLRSPII